MQCLPAYTDAAAYASPIQQLSELAHWPISHPIGGFSIEIRMQCLPAQCLPLATPTPVFFILGGR